METLFDQWVGLPIYHPSPDVYKLIRIFDAPEDRNEVMQKLGMEMPKMSRTTVSSRWPPISRQDQLSLRFESTW